MLREKPLEVDNDSPERVERFVHRVGLARILGFSTGAQDSCRRSSSVSMMRDSFIWRGDGMWWWGKAEGIRHFS